MEKVVLKSRLKYIISPKLKVYPEIVVKTISGVESNCMLYDEMCDLIRNVKLGKYKFREGYCEVVNNTLKVYTNKVYI